MVKTEEGRRINKHKVKFIFIEKIFVLMFLGIMIAPNFYYGQPLGMLNMVYIYMLGFFLLFVSRNNVPKKNIGIVLLLVFVSQILIFISFLNDEPEQQRIDAIFSMLRPVLWFVVFYGLYAFYINMKEAEEKIVKILEILTILMFLFNFLLMIDFLNIYNASLNFYGREKFVGKAVYINFFNVSYSAGYIAASLYAIFLPLFLITKRKKYLIFSCLTLFNVLYADSKSMYIATVLITLLAFILTSKSFFSKFLALSTVIISVYLYKVYLFDFLLFLESINFKQARSLIYIFFERESSGTFNARMEQIELAWNLVTNNNFYIGAGLGRHIYLETWISFYLYRYGIYGIVLFLGVVATLAYLSFINYNKIKNKNPFYEALLIGVFIWSLLLPFMLMSGPMNELEKTGFFTFVYIALLFNILYKISSSKGKVLT